MAKIFLNSDFRDWYDFEFATGKPGPDDFVLDRIANPDKDDLRNNRLYLLHTLKVFGFLTPDFGKVKDLKSRHPFLVVYTDPYAHCGEGKELVSSDDPFLDDKQDYYCSAFVGKHLDKSYSKRLLFVGEAAFEYWYSSTESWMSNVGDGQITEAKRVYCARPPLTPPLFAIDFVEGYAVDYNTAPGTRGTGLNKLLTSEGVYRLLEKECLKSKN